MKKAIPLSKQIAFLEWELGCFFHFGIRTFYDGHKDWDMKPMDLEAFNPTELDCKDWIKTLKEAGGKYAVFVAKHHDGFANWPSKYTEYSVKNTPWKDGQGDVVKAFVDACRAFDIKVGIYYSPAEFSMKENKKTAKAYDDYFIDQIGELLTQYGKIDYLWFDGCGSEDHEYDKVRIIRAIRQMQPEILIFNMWDPDTRWIGNEAGLAPLPYWNAVTSLDISVLTDRQESLEEQVFLPGECDCRMRKDNWFYSETDLHTVKTVEELMGLYYYSVGRGANLLVNIAPDTKGLLPKEDKANFIAFGKEIKRRFEHPLYHVGASEIKGQMTEHKLAILLDTDKLINHVILKESLLEGERIRRFKLSVLPYPGGKAICVYEGHNIGNKAICQFPSIKGKELLLEIIESDEDYVLEAISVYGITS